MEVAVGMNNDVVALTLMCASQSWPLVRDGRPIERQIAWSQRA